MYIDQPSMPITYREMVWDRISTFYMKDIKHNNTSYKVNIKIDRKTSRQPDMLPNRGTAREVGGINSANNKKKKVIDSKILMLIVTYKNIILGV